MAAYIIVQVNVTDPETFEAYRQQVPATLEPFGGEYSIRGGDMEVLEGEWAAPRVVVLKFPDMASAKARHASDIYAGPMAIRHQLVETNAIAVDGI